nr:cobalamin-dependent protein [Maliibacterium massiliense]
MAATKKIIGASIGNCVHVAGVIHFLQLAQEAGYEMLFLGPAVPVEEIIQAVRVQQPDMVALGYRLTPQNVTPIIAQLQARSADLARQPQWVFGGTRPVAAAAQATGFFQQVFDGTEDIDACLAYLRNTQQGQRQQRLADDVRARMAQKRPYPLLRHHFGLPSFADTRRGVARIAEAGVLDVISLGPDQNTQQYFFHPEARDVRMDGAGGVPIRTREDFIRLKEASQRGNYPMMRCYSGTADVMAFAPLLRETINNAWCAVPLCWYNELDGRGTRTLEQSMQEAQQLMRWHAGQNIPVEVNEPHHWGLRDAHDVISVAMAYISAYNAKRCGVRDYIAQYMFNVPAGMHFAMDLAKALAQMALVESLADSGFRTYRQVRAGLPFFSSDLDVAKGQLAASTQLSMALAPHIIHVVGYSEAEHAATPEVVIESCKIVRGVVRSVLHGNVQASQDARVLQRKAQLLGEASYLLDFIRTRYASVSADPLADARVLSDCIRRGILDAPHIVRTAAVRGILQTRMVDGRCEAYDRAHGRILSEEARLDSLAQAGNFEGLAEAPACGRAAAGV